MRAWHWSKSWGGAAAWPWPTQNFGWVGHSAFCPTNNWPVCSLILHCGQLILRKISRIGATRRQILRLKCTNSLSAGASPQTSLSPDLLTVFTRPTRKGTEGKGREGEEGREKGKEGRRGRRRDLAHPKISAWCPLWSKSRHVPYTK